MPWSLRMLAGRGIGLALYHFGRDRRYVAQVNIRLCFPELSAPEQQALVRQSFLDNGIGLIETATSWLRSSDYFSRLVTIRGLDVLQQAHARGRGVLLVGAHYSTLDLGGRLFSLVAPLACTYRPNKNPLFNAFMVRGRRNNCRLFDRRDIRGAFRYLRENGILWYAPDQDYGADHAVFAPFFGQQAATITATSRFARHNHSPVVIVRHHRLTHRKGYEMAFTEAPDGFPSGDDVADATAINRVLEAAIRQYPAQYLWMHKRFKTQPGGKPESPYIDSATSTRRISRDDIDRLKRLPGTADGYPTYQMPNGDRLKCFPGIARRPFHHRHPAWHFERMSKQLRLSGIDSLTVGRILYCRELRATLVSYTAPRGIPLSHRLPEMTDDEWGTLGHFFGRLHQAGFRLTALRPDLLYYHEADILLANPHEVTRLPMSLSVDDRFDSLAALRTHARLGSHMNPKTFAAFYAGYRATMHQDDRSRLDARMPGQGRCRSQSFSPPERSINPDVTDH